MAVSECIKLLVALLFAQICLANRLALLERQDCGAQSAYFPACYGCCSTDANTLSGAGCYNLLSIHGTSTITLPAQCYTTAPAVVVGTVTDSTTGAATTTIRSTAKSTASASSDQCASGHKECGDGCILSTSTCCPGGTIGCKAGYACYTDTDGSQSCCTPGLDCPGDSITSAATTARATALSSSLAASVPNLSTSTSLAGLLPGSSSSSRANVSPTSIPTGNGLATQVPTGGAFGSRSSFVVHTHWLWHWLMALPILVL